MPSKSGLNCDPVRPEHLLSNEAWGTEHSRQLVQCPGEVGTHLCPYHLPRTTALNSQDEEEGDPGVLGGSTIGVRYPVQ